ncbi:hypothetical protein EAE96_005168 [Botrytis aclada]|nr:hypothetical protein EAE96_005168 [Botrytis aclada]
MAVSDDHLPFPPRQYTINGRPVDFTEWLNKWQRAYSFEGFNILVDEPRKRYLDLGPIRFKLITTRRRFALFFQFNMRKVRVILSLILFWIILHMAWFIVCSCGVPEETCRRVLVLVVGRMWLHLSIHWCTHIVWSEGFSRRAKLLFALTNIFMSVGCKYLAIELDAPML